MKNETDRSKEKSKISVLKKKLTSTTETVSEEPEKKSSRKGKKLKKTSDENVKSGKSSFARKFTFGKYMSAPTEISRASSSKSMSESDSDKVSSSGYSTLTPTSQKCDEIEDKSFEETCTIDTCPEEGIESSNPPPISVTPYAISTWRSDSDKATTASEVVAEVNVATGPYHPNLMENKVDDKKDCEQVVAVDDDGIVDQVASSTKEGSDDIDENKETKKSEILDNTDTASEAMPAFGNLVMDLTKERPDASNISQSAERKEHLYKILVIGELGTGKTSIIKRYVHQFFSQHYRATIGVDFALKVLNWDANTIIRLQLWDIAGQERFGNMTRVYYKDAVGAFIVFDVTRVATFDAVDKWKQDLDSKVQLPDGSSIPCVLLGNKCDQQKEGIVNTPNRMDEYCKEKGFSGWFETSAKENINIEEAAKFLVNKILLNDKLLHSNEANKDTDRIAIDDKGNANGYNLKSSKTCSC